VNAFVSKTRLVLSAAMDSAFTIQVFTNATLNITLSTFSLWDALNPVNYRYSDLSPYSSYDTGYVFETACGADPNNQNCTASCLKPETVFGSLDTLRNCMAYPNIANEFANNRLSPDDQTTAKKLGIERTSINDTLSIDVIHTVLTCLHDYCDSLPGCMDAMKRELVDYSEGAMLNQTSTFYFGGNGSPDSDFNPCSFLPQSFLNVNQDIGGIGVFDLKSSRPGLLLTSNRSMYLIGFRSVLRCWASLEFFFVVQALTT